MACGFGLQKREFNMSFEVSESTFRILPSAGFLAVAFLLCALGLGVLSKILYERHPTIAFRGGICIAVLISALSAFLLPISPINDSLSVATGLSQLLGDGLAYDWSQPYFAFYANNKVTLALYWGITTLVRNVELGIRITNFLCLFATAFFLSGSIHRIFGAKYRNFGLFVCLLFFPHIILTSPYSYPIAIALASIAFYLCLSTNTAHKPLFFLVAGVLFLVRPTAAIFLFVFFAFSALRHFLCKERRQGLFALCTIAGLFASIFFIQLGVGAAFYRTGFHPWPNLTDGATNWTLDIGTRLDGPKTGSSMYTPFGVLPEHLQDDEIALMQQRLFGYFMMRNPEDYPAVTALNHEIRSALLLRARENFAGNPSNVFLFYGWKTIGLFQTSDYRFYFYTLDIDNPSFSWQAQRNLGYVLV